MNQKSENQVQRRKTMKLNKKHIQTVKTFDQCFYREGRAYHIFFKNHPDAEKMGDYGDGTVCLCTAVNGGCVEFTHSVHHFVGGIKTKSVKLVIKDVEKYDIDIYPCYTDSEVLHIIDLVKKEPDKWHGKSDYNDDVEEDTIDHASLRYVYNNYLIIVGRRKFPLIIDTADAMSPVEYAFNIEQLRELRNSGILLQIESISNNGEESLQVELQFDSIDDTDGQTVTFVHSPYNDMKRVLTVENIIKDFKSFTISPWKSENKDECDEEAEDIIEGEEDIDEGHS